MDMSDRAAPLEPSTKSSDASRADVAPAPTKPKVDLNAARPLRWGWWLLILGFGSFAVWATIAPLDAGVGAPGSVVVSGNRKAVQPLVGGKIAAITVKDGDEVKAGQVLVRLDPTQSKSQLDVARGQWFSAAAVEARLTAERAGRASIQFPSALQSENKDPRAAAAMALQTQLFMTRRAALTSELTILRENERGLEARLQGLQEATLARREQARLLQEEIRFQADLARDGFLPRNRLSEQQRQLAALNAAIADDAGNIGQIRQQIAEVRARAIAREHEVRKEIETQLTDVQKESASLASRLQALEFEVANTEIASPADGIVVGLAVHTVGGVVSIGAPLMEIVPKNEPLRVDAQIAPHLIDKVKPGLDVDISFTAFQQAITPHIPGKVTLVSADVLQDQKQQASFFKATIEVTPEGMKKLRQHQIRAGMPAEVFIRTGERTLLNYLLKPLFDRMNRALTEP